MVGLRVVGIMRNSSFLSWWWLWRYWASELLLCHSLLFFDLHIFVDWLITWFETGPQLGQKKLSESPAQDFLTFKEAFISRAPAYRLKTIIQSLFIVIFMPHPLPTCICVTITSVANIKKSVVLCRTLEPHQKNWGVYNQEQRLRFLVSLSSGNSLLFDLVT